LRARARSYHDGIYAVVANRKRIAPQALSANVKSNNYLNMMLAQREVQADHPGAWALMCDANGNLAEGAGCNFFIVSNGEIVTPTDEFVLQGVSRQVVFEICDQAGITITRRAVTLEDALEADEAFFSSTSLCVCPVSRLNDHNYAAGNPGPVTDRIMKDFARMAEFDFVAQYLAFASQAEPSTGL
jgi:branched-chain amino acid aminotransferase